MNPIETNLAPLPLGCYSQAIVSGSLVFLAGQIGLDPKSGELKENFESQLRQIFINLQAVANAAGVSLSQAVKLNIYLKNLSDFACVNEVMQAFFVKPYPARTTIEVSNLPKGALVEIDGILTLS